MYLFGTLHKVFRGKNLLSGRPITHLRTCFLSTDPWLRDEDYRIVSRFVDKVRRAFHGSHRDPPHPPDGNQSHRPLVHRGSWYGKNRGERGSSVEWAVQRPAGSFFRGRDLLRACEEGGTSFPAGNRHPTVAGGAEERLQLHYLCDYEHRYSKRIKKLQHLCIQGDGFCFKGRGDGGHACCLLLV